MIETGRAGTSYSYSCYHSLPVPAGQIVTEGNPAHGAGFEIWVGLAGITDDMAFSALVDLLRRPGYFQADRTLQQTVGGAGQSSDRREVGWAGLVLSEASIISGQGVVPGIKLSDSQLAPSVLSSPPRLPPHPANYKRDQGDEEENTHDDSDSDRADGEWR